MSAVYAARLVAYAPNGDRLGLLPEPLSWNAAINHSDTGAAQVVYSRKAARGELLQRALTDGLEVAVEVVSLAGASGAQVASWDDARFTWDDARLQWDGLILESSGAAVPWFEPDNARFIAVKRGWSVDDKTDTVTLTMPSYGWMLAKIRSLNVAALLPEDHTEAGKRPFLSANAGVILATILGEYETRHSVSVPRSFDTATDSDGVAWAHVTTLYFEHGLPLDVIWQNLVASGMADVAWRGRSLRVTNPAAGVQRSVRLHLGADISEAPSEETIEDLISHMTVQGGDGLHVTEHDPSAPTPWGPWEGFYSNESITLHGTATQYAQAELARSGRLRGQYTRDLLVTSRHAPFLDFGVGDWITAPTTSHAGERVRVAAITLRQDAGQPLVAGLTLNDRFLDAEVKRARRQRGIVGGSSTVEGGSTVRPAPEGPDKRVPAAPLGLVVATSAYVDANGNPRGLVMAECAAVTTARAADGGGALDVDRYEWAVGKNVVGAVWPVVRVTSAPEVEVDNLNPGDEVRVRVRARGTYATAPGEWSATQVVTVADDVTPPPVPSLLVPSSARGVASFHWDGLTHLGTAMPIDYSHSPVQLEGTAWLDSAPVAVTDTLYGPGAVHLPGLRAGTSARARIRAVDRSGNASDWTSWVTVTVASVLDDTGLAGALDSLDDDVADIRDNVLPGMAAALDMTMKSSVVEYAVGASETVAPVSGWSTSTPTRTPGTFIWYRTRVTYSDDSTSLSSPALLTGNTGAKGDDGTSVSIKGSVASSANLPTSGVVDGDGYITEDTGHLWIRTSGTWVDAGEIRGPAGADGDPGPAGDDGIGIASLTPFFRTTDESASAPAKPTTASPPSPWSLTEPGYTPGTALWRTERIVYTDATFDYTAVTKVSSYTAASQARALALSADLRVNASTAAPTAGDAAGRPEGALWYRYTGDALVGAWRLVGGAWVAAPLDRTFIPAIDIGTGTFGDLDGFRLKAKTVYTEALAVGAANLFPDPHFRNAAAWTVAGVTAVTVDANMPGGRRMTLIGGTGTVGRYYNGTLDRSTDLEAGAQYRVRFTARRGGPNVASVPAVMFYARGDKRSDGSLAISSVTIPIPASSSYLYGPMEGIITIPEDWKGPCTVGFYLPGGVDNTGAGVYIGGVSLERVASSVLIADGAVTGSKLFFDEAFANTLVAGIGDFDSVFAGFVDATMLKADMALVNDLIAGAAAGQHMRLGPTGLRGFSVGPEGDTYESIRLGQPGQGDVFALTSAGGETMASISGDGGITGRTVDVAGYDTDSDGVPDSGLTIYGREFLDWLDTRPKGIVGRGLFTTFAGYSGSEQGVREIKFVAEPGRMYAMHLTGGLLRHTVAPRSAGWGVRLSRPSVVDGEAAAPTTANTRTLGVAYAAFTQADTLTPSMSWSGQYGCPPNGVRDDVNFDHLAAGLNKILITLNPNGSGTITGQDTTPAHFWVEDIGPWFPRTDAANTGGGTSTAKGKFTTTWVANDSESYTGGNASRGSNDSGHLIHGYTSYYPAGGIQWGHSLFTAAATAGGERGKTLAAAMSGATVSKATLRVYVNHMTAFSGTHTFQVRARTDTSVNHSTGTPVTTTALTGAATKRGQWVNIDITAIFTTATRGIQIGKTTSTSPTQYVRIDGHANPNKPQLIVEYQR